VVVHDLDVVSIAVLPPKANAPLIVDPDTVLAPSVARQLLQAIRRRNPEIVQNFRSIQNQQFPQGDSLDSPEPPGVPPLEDSLRLFAAEALDHVSIITRRDNIVKRYYRKNRESGDLADAPACPPDEREWRARRDSSPRPSDPCFHNATMAA
jgi:hypothetical protein